MATVEKKFIFTDEGRDLLISQDGGIRIAAIGGILVQGYTPVSADELWETYRGLTFEQLIDNDQIMLGLPTVSYRSLGNGLVKYISEDAYRKAINDIKSGNLKNLYGTFYMPNRELHSQSGSHYGTYEFTYDKTSFQWDMQADVSFNMLVLLGKQYSETKDATFNIDDTQRPVIVGIAQLPGEYDEETGIFEGGISFLEDHNEYICTSLRLQFTLTDDDHDATELIIDNEEYMEMTRKLSIVNDGLKSDSSVHIVDTNQPVDTLNKLDANLSNTDTLLRVAPEPGSVATQYTMMVADPYMASEVENQWNPAAQLHIVNKKVDKDNETMYKEQIVLTTLEEPENLNETELTSYYAGLMLRGSGNYIIGDSIRGAGPEYVPTSGASGSSGISGISANIHYEGIESPIFRQVAVPEYDRYAVDIFGIENKILDKENIDKYIFSQRNVTVHPAGPEEYGYEDDTVNYGYNVILNSHENYMNGNTNNMFVRANGNILSGYSNNNLLFGADRNLLQNGANTNLIFGSDLNIFTTNNTQGNIVIGGGENYVDNTTRSVYFNGTGLKSFSRNNKLLMGTFNADSTATWIYGCGTDGNHRKNAMEFYPETGSVNLYNNGNLSVSLGGEKGILMPPNTPLETDILHSNKIWTNYLTVAGSPSADNGYMRITTEVPQGTSQQFPDFYAITRYNDKVHTLRYHNAYDTLYIGTTTNASWDENSVSLDKNTAVFKYIDGDWKNFVLINKTYQNGQIHDTEYAKLSVVNDGRGQVKSVTEVTPAGLFIDPLESQKSVSLTTAGLTINTDNSHSITFGPDTPLYNKICADVFIWGSSVTDYSVGVRSIRGGRPSDRTWLANLFNQCPPILYESNDGSGPLNGNYRIVYRYNGQTYNKAHDEMTDDEWNYYHSVLGANNSRYVQIPADSTDSDDDEVAPAIYSLLPTGIDEIELHIYTHDFAGNDIGFIWVPLVDNSDVFQERPPLIKIIIHIDNKGSGEQVWAFINKNYNTTGDPEFRKSSDMNWYNCIKLSCTPTYRADYMYLIPDRSNDSSHPWGWWCANSGPDFD